jgi:hypothetical protein
MLLAMLSTSYSVNSQGIDNKCHDTARIIGGLKYFVTSVSLRST